MSRLQSLQTVLTGYAAELSPGRSACDDRRIGMGFKLDNISFSIDGHKIVDQVSLDAANGEFICLLGPSGCGKTTTLRLLSGLEQPDEGRIFLKDRVVHDDRTKTPPEKRRAGFLFQDFALFPHLSVRENIAFGLKGQSDTDSNIDELLEAVQMSRYADSMPHSLSGGQQQRVALARAMAPHPHIMLLDEPFSGLDTSLRESLRSITRQILKRNQTTTVMVTHDPEEAMFMADKIALMNGGKIIEIGTPRQLYHSPKTEFAMQFLGDVERFEGQVSGEQIKTRFGTFPNDRFRSGDTLRGYIRPEHIELKKVSVNAETDSSYRVVESHCLGEKHLVDLQADQPGAIDDRLHMKVRLEQDLHEGDRVTIKAEREHLVLFS